MPEELTALDEKLSQLRAALEQQDSVTALAILDRFYAPDQAELLEGLDEDEQAALLPALDPVESAELLAEMEDGAAAELVAALPTATLARIMDEMAPDDAADLLANLEPEQAQSILAALEDPDEIRPLLLYPETSAGGLMTPEFLALRRRMTAAEALQAIRDWKPRHESLADLFVVDAQGAVCGQVDLRDLIVASPNTLVRDIMDPDVIAVPVGTDQEECAQLMLRYSLLVLAVVNAEGALLGVITAGDVMDVIEEEATEDIQRLGGAQPLDEPYLDTPILTVARKRVGWLLLLFVTESLTGSVLRHFENELQSLVALSFFVPLLIGTGGNAGSQTTSTIIRALAVGDIRLRDTLATLWHEIRAAVFLALIMGVVAYARALMWGTGPGLALVVSISIATIVLWANGLGAVLPLLAAALHIDPTVVSGPAMSTLVDATGLFIYFTIARLIIGL